VISCAKPPNSVRETPKYGARNPEIRCAKPRNTVRETPNSVRETPNSVRETHSAHETLEFRARNPQNALMGRPPSTQHGPLVHFGFRVTPRSREALIRAAEKREISVAELLDQLCGRAKLYGPPDA